MRPDGPSCAIRQAELSDLPRLHEIRQAAFAPVFMSFRDLVGDAIAEYALSGEEVDQARHLDELMRSDQDVRIFLAHAEDVVLGFVTVILHRDQSMGEIGLNAVDPLHAGKGIGTRLYEFALEEMRREGMKCASVGTGADDSHAPARSAYAKAGFTRAIPSVWLYREL